MIIDLLKDAILFNFNNRLNKKVKLNGQYKDSKSFEENFQIQGENISVSKYWKTQALTKIVVLREFQN